VLFALGLLSIAAENRNGFMIRVFIGFDSRETAAFYVLSHSIHAHASEPVAIAPLALHQLRHLFTRARLAAIDRFFAFPIPRAPSLRLNNTLSVLQRAVIMRRNGAKIELRDNVKDLFGQKKKPTSWAIAFLPRWLPRH
jgi:hypothetical protein